MPHSLKSKIKSLCYKGEISEKERDRLIHALEQQPSEDVISREDVINIIEDVCPIYENDYRYILKDKIAQLPSVTPQQVRWIPCSERMPEKQTTIGGHVFSENVLGTEGYTIRRAYYNYTTKEWFDGNEEMEWNEITHWMPLPEEPYKIKSEDEE